MFCIAKSRSTPHCVIHCTADEAICRYRNDQTTESANNYPSDILDALLMRFETPIATNRWDSPLFAVGEETASEEGLSGLFRDVSDALLRGAAPVPNKATQNPTSSPADYLQQIEEQTQAVVKFIVDMQKTLPAGTSVAVPGSDKERFALRRYQTVAELQRSRRQFVASLCRVRSNNSSVSNAAGGRVDNLADAFVIYLNKCS